MPYIEYNFRKTLLKCTLSRGTTTITTIEYFYIDNYFYLLLCILPSVKLFIFNFINLFSIGSYKK